jgi:hypothetical protein
MEWVGGGEGGAGGGFVKLQRCEFDHSPSSSAMVKNEWNYTSAPPLCLHGMDWDNLAFFNFAYFIVWV